MKDTRKQDAIQQLNDLKKDINRYPGCYPDNANYIIEKQLKDIKNEKKLKKK